MMMHYIVTSTLSSYQVAAEKAQARTPAETKGAQKLTVKGTTPKQPNAWVGPSRFGTSR
jgi:hypothetical protein